MRENFGRESIIAVQPNKFILNLILITSCLLANDEVLLLAKLKFEKAHKNYEDKISICSKGDHYAISPKELSPLKMSRQEWMVAFFYLKYYYYNKCIYSEKNNFIIAVNTYIETARHYNVFAL